ncbi:FYVE zinc finger-domain-containing protein, partial [Vararia minispora EC-137]
VNAASKGHLPVVLYLLTKQSANPLVRNNWGETAYDVAAAVFEVWICEVLSRFEAEKWRSSTAPYDPLSVHTTVALILYENQRLDTRFRTLAASGGRPRFTASGLGKNGRRPPFELKLLVPDERNGQKTVGAWRSDVQLPLREDPLKLPLPGLRTHAAPDGAERSHFWLSDWTLDVTHPSVDAETGWQYSQNFADPDEQWTPDPPPQLERILQGSSASAIAGFGSSSSSRSRLSSSSSHVQGWVRRRRWVRVMRRRLDIPPLPFSAPDGGLYHWLSDGTLIPFEETINDFADADGAQELSSISMTITAEQDYISHARYLAGEQSEAVTATDQSTVVDVRRAIAKLERATTELRQGLTGDDDAEHRTQAEVLLNAYNRELERRKAAATQQGLLLSSEGTSNYDDDDDDDDSESFHYPGASVVAPSIAGRSYTTDYFGRMGLRGPTDLTPHLSQAPEFRVPTHEAPQKIVTPMYTPPTPHEVHVHWERDHQVSCCRDCQRRFTFLLRRHCRRCGRIFCDRCSSYRTLLDPSDIVHDPAVPDTPASASSQRVCQSCYEAVNVSVPSPFSSSRVASMERIFIDQGRLSVPRLSRQTSSQLSDLNDCPVCGMNLGDLGPAAEQEAHVRTCLEGDTSKSPQVAKYLVYKLPSESALIGVECVICLEEFVTGSTVARLSCLCSFHNACLSSWLQRGKSCPVHARDP